MVMSGLDNRYQELMKDIMKWDASAHDKIAEELSSTQINSNEAMAIACIYGVYGFLKNLDMAEDYANEIQNSEVKTRVLSEIEFLRELDKKIGEVAAIGRNMANKKRAEAQNKMDDNIKISPLKVI